MIMNELFIKGISNPSRRVKQSTDIKDTYLPIKVRYTTSRQEVICQTPDDIESGKSFIVLEVNVEGGLY